MDAKARDQLLLQADLDQKTGRFREAEAKCRELLSTSPRFAAAKALLGSIAAKTGRAALAIDLLREAAALDKRAVTVRAELGMLLLRQGQAENALPFLREAVRLKPQDAEAYNNLGLAYLDLRRFAEAIASFEKATTRKPVLAGAHHNLGVAQEALGQEAAAAVAYRCALALAPDLAASHVRLGRLLAQHDQREEALAVFRAATWAQPNSATGELEAARLLVEEGRVAEAEALLRRAAEREPPRDETHERLGSALVQLGRFDQAIASFERALAIAPRNTQACLGLVQAKKIAAADLALVEGMTALLCGDGLSEPDRMRLHYALGKAADDLGHYDDAMRHFDEANRMAAQRLRETRHMIDRAAHTANIDRLIATFSADFFAANAALGCDSELPILIVGMIRSGTTLVEQIVSSHPAVGAGGELPFWGRQGASLTEVAEGRFGREHALAMADDYCRVLRAKNSAAVRVTDKMPTNFLLLGLAHLVLPRARIIHCRRDPVNTCLSIYMTPYSNLPDFAHDRGNIVYYYEEYRRLMAHWRRVLPADRFLEIDYEDLVAAPEPATRRMLAFCGLAWDDACLRPESNPRAIQTPSSWQARQPVYRHAVLRWRRYEPYLGAFRRLVADP